MPSEQEERATLAVDQRDIGYFMAQAGSGRRQSLEGFDPDYTDIVDYIVRCTHKIWEEKAIGLIYTHYAHNAIVHSSHGVVYGCEAVVRNTLQSQAMTADLRAYADDVIWSGNERDGFYTSHRVFDTSTHTGYSEFGPPTGRKFQRWVIADCFSIENKIVEEWLAYDATAGLRQMGYDPLEVAHKAVLDESSYTRGEIDRLPTGQQAPEFLSIPEPDDPQGFIKAVLHNLWNARLVNMIRAHYTPGHVAFVPGGRKLYGYGDYENFVITLLASFPDLALTVDHQCHLGDERRGYRVATRFTLQGTHEGYGPYGAPTGRRIFLIGMSHHVIKNGRIVQEWTVFDEFALLKQLYARKGGKGAV
ncbi:ester cyclase [Calidithermus roseus]|uniref:SnoaL-like polyketide cyclase n=1 Tax=Calidithermus roseus TaxID=1644118 RepID=A0A399EV20_9DEIN|nr:ester cyclase [Calidithermus roseus]RIH87888.1 SnoaL-like polyketide cyclase [Calidithermus roseus]